MHRSETSAALFALSPEPDGLELALVGAVCSQSVASAGCRTPILESPGGLLCCMVPVALEFQQRRDPRELGSSPPAAPEPGVSA